jgi:hypothetical protein
VKGAQRLKVLTDAFKLTWIAKQRPGVPRLVLCMADDEAVEVIVVPLPTAVRGAVVRAQQRQFR